MELDLRSPIRLLAAHVVFVQRIQHCHHLEQLRHVKAVLLSKRRQTPTNRLGVTASHPITGVPRGVWGFGGGGRPRPAPRVGGGGGGRTSWGGVGVQPPPPPRNSEVLKKLGQLPSSVEYTSVTT
jgi:hypothetical protein